MQINKRSRKLFYLEVGFLVLQAGHHQYLTSELKDKETTGYFPPCSRGKCNVVDDVNVMLFTDNKYSMQIALLTQSSSETRLRTDSV